MSFMCRNREEEEKAVPHKKETEYYMEWIEDLGIEAQSKARISQCLFWYLQKAKHNKQGFYFTSVLSMALSAAIPVINGLTSNGTPSLAKILVSVFAALSAFAVGLNSFFNYKEKWNRNRITAEKLKRELALFQARADKYDPEQYKPEDKFDPVKALAIETEKICSAEAYDWLKGQKNKKGEDKSNEDDPGKKQKE